MPRPKRSNPLALAVLSTLLTGPAHPYELATTMRERGKHESIRLNYGSLYSVVEQLERAGLIRPVETVREGKRPERTVYELTVAGRAEHDHWLAELLSTPVKEYPAFEAALSLMPGLPPEEVVRLLRVRGLQLEIAIRQLKSARDVAAEHEIPRLFLIEDEYRVALLESEARFVASLVDEIESGRLGEVELWRAFIDAFRGGAEPEKNSS
ncbi:MAG: PadR family transcriptional regulator [Chloroflexi bacterium]|nr:MAG: PadR family transcriptional regulator [Chloroflexota bacterium]